MKKIISCILILVLLFGVTINADSIDNNSKKELSDKIKMVMAYGINEKDAKKMTDLEISDLFKTSEITDYSLVPQMIDRDKMKNDIEMRYKESIDYLIEKGFTKTESKAIIDSGLNYYEDTNNTKEDIQLIYDKLIQDSMDELNENIMRVFTPYHQWYGTEPANLLDGETNCRFHGNAYPTSVNKWVGGVLQNCYFGYLTLETHQYYDDKTDMLETDTTAAMKAAYKLYNTSSADVRGTYNLWGELPSKYQTTWTDTHKGIDFQSGTSDGESIYSIFDLTGEVSYRLMPSSTSNVSFLCVYYSSIDVTVIYEHLEFDDQSMYVGKTVTKNTKLGTESNYGASEHTHIQLQSGEVDSFSDIKTLINSSTELNTLDPAAYFAAYVPNI